jgi:ketosteroid isomerase-like protein
LFVEVLPVPGEFCLKFQWVEKIPVADPERVLRALEDRLRVVSSEVVREGNRITLTGLGPSPRVMNRRDRTVIDVKGEDGFTTIAADILCQASSLLGDAPQDAVVRAKLDRVFAEMREELGLKAAPARMAEAHKETENVLAEEPATSHGLPRMRFAAEIPVVDLFPSVAETVKAAHERRPAMEEESPAPVPVAGQIEVAEKSAEPDAVAESREPEATGRVVETSGEKEAAAAAPVIAEEKKESVLPPKPMEMPPVIPVIPELAAEKAPENVTTIAKGKRFSPAEQQVPKFTTVAPEKPEPVEGENRSSRLLQWGAWAAAFIVLVLAPAAWLYLPRGSNRDSIASQQTLPIQPAQLAPAAAATPQLAAPQVESPAVAAANDVPAKEQDPSAMVKDWEAALQSTDAAKQAAFYADPAERYFLRHNVSRDSIRADKQSQIAKRQGEWAIAMEQVKVHQQEDTASVHLIKHFTVRKDGKLTSQWYVPSLLQLKRVDGVWQITSERDLGWANTLDDLE